MDTIHASIETIFKFEKIDKKGNILQTVGPFPNLVTNAGLDNIADRKLYYATDWIKIGSGTSEPQYTDTDLENEVVRTSNKDSDSYSGSIYPPCYSSRISVFQWNEGEVVATGDVDITEVGLWDEDNSVLLNRQLLPEAINVAYDQGLRVQAETRYYYKDVPGVPTSGSFEFNGETITYKRYVSTEDLDGGSNIFTSYRGQSAGVIRAAISQDTDILVNSISSDERNYSSYIPGAFERTAEFIWNPGTLVGDYYTIEIGHGRTDPVQTYMFYLDTPITMTDLEELTLNFKVSWGRYDSSAIEEWDFRNVDLRWGKDIDINYGSDYDGWGDDYNIIGSPTLSGDYIYFDGIDDGLEVEDRTINLRDSFEIKFRAHDKNKGRYQIIYADCRNDDYPGWSFSINPSGDIEFWAGDPYDNAQYITLPSSGYNENEIYYLVFHKWKHTLELFDDAEPQNLVMKASFESDPGYSTYAYNHPWAGCIDDYCIIDGEDTTARYFFEGDIFHIYTYDYLT